MNRLLIRAEYKNQWERRTPLVPADVKKLKDEVPAQVLLQPSAKRCFPVEQYVEAGAQIAEELQAGDIVLGIKEIPSAKILPEKVYLFFSHTIKGQPGNMEMLERIIQTGGTLIDYELIRDRNGRRLVFFGPYAGQAGAIDACWLLGRYFFEGGTGNPLARCKQALEYPSLAGALESFREVGKRIEAEGLPEGLHPLIIAIIGYGQVASGVRQVLECFPLEYVRPEDLQSVSPDSSRWDPKRVYAGIFREEDLVERRAGGAFRLEEYYASPGSYRSRLSHCLAPVSVLINAVYWEPRYPKFVTWEDLRERADRLRLIADITCDVGGSIESTLKSTDSGNPAYRVDVTEEAISENRSEDDIMVLAVDNLPAELPVDSSSFFSDSLLPWLPALVQARFDRPLDRSGLPEELSSATIVYRGELTPPFRYLESSLSAQE